MVMGETKIGRYEQQIKENLSGWVKLEDFRNALSKDISAQEINNIKEQINERGNLRIRRTGNTASKSTYFVKQLNGDPYKQYKEQIPEETHGILEEYIGKGYAPRVIVATIDYLTDKNIPSMNKAAEKHGCNSTSIQNNREEIQEKLYEKGIETFH
jgi:hypothetical protein